MDFSKKTVLLFLVFGFSSGLLAEKSEAGQLPLWEAAVGLVGFSFPDYRGSDETRFYALPFPYFIYRGDVFKMDRDRVRVPVFSEVLAGTGPEPGRIGPGGQQQQ